MLPFVAKTIPISVTRVLKIAYSAPQEYEIVLEVPSNVTDIIGPGAQAAATATITSGEVSSIAVTSGGYSYNAAPNVVITDNTIEHLDTIHDGFYSIVFNTVPGATGIELEWTNEGRFKHWTIREIEAYATGAPISFNIIDSSFNENGKPVIIWESVQNIIYAIDMSYDLNEWLEITDDMTGQSGTTPFVHEDFVDGTPRIFYRVRTP